MSKNQ